jgi:formylglycine-generating enzyme required for sulfatase activity
MRRLFLLSSVVFVILLSFVVTFSAEDWDPVINNFRGVPMVMVPEGCFDMGYEEGSSLEQPTREVCIEEAFWIDQFEVSNKQFNQFDGQAELPPYTISPTDPRVNIMWVEALAFCEIRGGRLPTEVEWEYAARGPMGNLFFDGNTPKATEINACDSSCNDPFRDETVSDGYAEVAPTGSFDNATWVGAYDMNGNVWEWVNGVFVSGLTLQPRVVSDPMEYGTRILRGGAWDDQVFMTRATVRGVGYSNYDVRTNVGFRCAKDS